MERAQFLDFRPELMSALKATRIAREILMSYFGNLKQVSEKYQAGLVSEADKNSEIAIMNHLKTEFPQYGFLGEESSDQKSIDEINKKYPEGYWVVDPLDGTTNYIHQFPIFCISIALVKNSQALVGAIDVPMLNQTFTAIKNQGAFLNGEKISVSKTQELKSSLTATGFFGENEKLLEEQLKIFSHIVRRCRGVRRPGAAAYDLCLVAQGVFDLFWERNLKPWDTSAGMLLVEEAGGVNVTYRGQKYDPFKNSMIAGNPTVVNEFLTHVKPFLHQETN